MIDLNGMEPTNSFFTANLDVLKTNSIEDPMINVSRLATLDLEESYTAIANKFVSELNDTVANAKISFYRSVSEATNEFNIHESFVSLASYINQIVRKVIAFLNDLAGKAISALMQRSQNHQFIISHEKDFRAFKDDMTFMTEGYNFSFDPDIPKANALIVYNESLFNDLYAGVGAATSKNVSAANVSYNSNPEERYDIFRGRVIGYDDKPISLTEYPNELFKVYRNGSPDGTTSKIVVDKKYVMAAFARVKDRAELKKQIDKNRSDAEAEYKRIETTVRKIDDIIDSRDADRLINDMPGSFKVDSGELENRGRLLSADFAAAMGEYINNKVTEIQQYSAIHIQAFSAKLEAIQACYNQDMNTLYSAYNVISGFGSKREE